MNVINKPEVSKYIALMYWAIVVFIAALIAFFVYAGFITPMGTAGIIASIVFVIVGAIMALLLRSLYRTQYIITEKELAIKTSKLIGGNKTIPLQTITSVKEIPIPFGIRLFGASFHGGYYHIPSLGRTFLSITNFHDGLLIESKKGNYIISPKNRMDFKKEIEKRIKA